jgi:hypothetical protein
MEESPILTACFESLEPGSTEPLAISDEGFAKISSLLNSYKDSPELEGAVLDLVRFALFVQEQKQSRSAGFQLLHLAASMSDALLDAAGLTGERREDALLEAAKRLSADLAQTREPPRPPASNEVRADPLARFELNKKKGAD